MSIGFLSDAQAASYGRFDGVPPRSDLERFFFLDDADRDLIGDRRGDHNRLGFMFQASTVHYLGAFLEDPLDVPWPVVEYLAVQLGISDPSWPRTWVAGLARQFFDQERGPVGTILVATTRNRLCSWGMRRIGRD